MAPTDTDLIWDRVLRLDEKVDQVLALLKELEQHQSDTCGMIAQLQATKKRKRRPIGFEVIGGGVIPQDTGGPSGGED